MPKSLKTTTLVTLLILVTIYVAVQVYDQFRLTRTFNYMGYQWCREVVNEIYQEQSLSDKASKSIDNCREAFKEKFQLPMRESDT